MHVKGLGLGGDEGAWLQKAQLHLQKLLKGVVYKTVHLWAP